MSQNGKLSFYPPKKHPYVFINEDYVKELLAKKDTPAYKDIMAWLDSQKDKELPRMPEDKILSATVSRALEIRAFLYAIGYADEAYAKETVEFTIEYLTDPLTRETYSISIYKDFGTNGMQTGAMVYDWCYNAMTDEQRLALAERVRTLMYAKEQPCRPDNVRSWSDIVGKAVGQPLIYNSVTAVALYDVYPEIYEAVMPKILGNMAEAMKLYGSVGALTDGSISYTRDHYAYTVEMLFARMGYFGIYGDQRKLGYRIMYSRLPYGALVKMGDDFSHAKYKIGNYVNSTETTGDLGLLGVIYNDPYLRFQYLKENYAQRGLMALLLRTSEVEPKLPDGLPLAFEVTEPRCDIIARTGWQSGMDSPTVVACLSMNNRRSGDHDHADIGNFQLYYKGPLTIPGGIYSGVGWGKSHWHNYYTRTVSANCVTVYDPDEKFVFGSSTAEANDGGQRMIRNSHGGYTISDFNEHISDENIHSVKLGSYIGPNKNTPHFSYIKGDLTRAYTEKMRSYRRSMVFMDTFNKDYPGALVVFDRVISSRPDFKKKWLLQCVTEPLVKDGNITVKMTEEGCNGKLVNRTLLPENSVCETVGGVGKFVVDGVEYPADDKIACSPAYAGGFRCEISPVGDGEEDLFLNAMYVTDADSEAKELTAERIDTPTHVGAKILDRVVLFSKDSEPSALPIDIKISDIDRDEAVFFIADLECGIWQVKGDNGLTLTLKAEEGEGALVFKAPVGEYSITRVSDSALITPQDFPEVSKSKTGDFAVKLGSVYTYALHENKLINGEPYISADFLERYCGVSLMREGNTLTLEKTGIRALVKADALDYFVTSDKEAEKRFANAPFISKDGGFYLPVLSELFSFFGIKATYEEFIKVVKMSYVEGLMGGELKGVDKEREIKPMAVYASSDDGNTPENTLDRSLDTRWSSIQGDGEWICFDLGKECSISSVQIAFYNGDKRKWRFDIQISKDGKTFTTVLSDMRSGCETLYPETFELPFGTVARYVRYVGHGETVTGTLNNSLTEFVINK